MVRNRFISGRSSPFKLVAKGCAGALALLIASAGPATSQPMPLIPAPSIVRATPALWEIRDADTTIYLFGTFHTLDGRTAWFDSKVRQAFDESGELVLETVIPEDISAAGQHATETGPDGKRRLKPFIAQTKKAMRQGSAMGMSVENGADAVLRRVAEGAGKQVSGLERFEDQLKTLSNIPAGPPPAAAAAARSEQPAVVTINDLLGAWTKGDTGAFSTMLAGFESKS
ncbi:MAG TPA: TraB/GumN family protein, partial [Sphingomicrobium sp.]|nr:TraB/GumN family protein [Sphingomicrobium sp.]